MNSTGPTRRQRRTRALLVLGGSLGVVTFGVISTHVMGLGSPGGKAGGGGQIQVPTTPEAFVQPGTQPDPEGETLVPVWHSNECVFCHATYLAYDPKDGPTYAEPWDGWTNSMMAQSVRDPIWQAALAIANQDAAGAGEFCIRCHAPGAWLSGKSVTGDLSKFEWHDFDGINCHFCHRMVNPQFGPDSPKEDKSILAALEHPPGPHDGNARFVVDPESTRRGPFDDVPLNMHEPDPIIYSPFHRDSAACGVCHDVSNPVYMRQPDGTYVLTALDEPHPTQNPHDMMPEQRTYSEWLYSEFAKGGVYFPDGRFGGNHPTGVMQSCQDCHMPKKYTGGCFAWEFEPFFPRPDMPMHHFAGANTWVLGAILDHYGPWDTGLSEQSVDDAHARTADMLRNAADLELEIIDEELRVRVVNWSGHKLPTGYPEGRRMWINVLFLDSEDRVISEHGHYDYVTAVLETEDTKVYEMKLGMDEAVAAATGLEPGKSFHLVLNNVVLQDNRIPPVGFTNKAFEAVRAEPVGYTYADGQHWDDTYYLIPTGATAAIATLYYQTTTREYIEFLRDTNVTNDAGQLAYDLWVAHGKSAPLDMNSAIIEFESPGIPGDLNGDGVVNVFDLLILLSAWGICSDPGNCPADLNGDGLVNVFDLLILLGNWG